MFKIKEKFIIHTVMSQEEMWKKLEDNIRKFPYKSLSVDKNKDFIGKIQGYKFEMTRMSLNRRGFVMNPVIKGETKEGSVVIEIKHEKITVFIFYAFIFLFIGSFITALIVLFKQGMESKSLERQISSSFYFLFPLIFFIFDKKISNEKEFLKNLFNGTIEEIAAK